MGGLSEGDTPLIADTAGLADDQPGGAPAVRPMLGTLALLLGAGIVFLAFVDQTAPLPFMPVSWYADRAMWYWLALGLFAGGWLLLRSSGRADDRWRPAGEPGPRFRRVRLYTREGCHLCDQAKDALLVYRAFLPEIEEVDIDGDSELTERFTDCVPVVEIDGKVRFRGGVNEVLLRRLIDTGRHATDSPAPVRGDSL